MRLFGNAMAHAMAAGSILRIFFLAPYKNQHTSIQFNILKIFLSNARMRWVPQLNTTVLDSGEKWKTEYVSIY